jgi:thiol-disulfide isomerase/thioredoxin
MFALTVGSAACGPDATIAELTAAADYADSPIKVFVGSTPSGAQLALSAPKESTSARYCVLTNSACDDWEDLDSMSGPSGRAYFGTKQFTASTGRSYRVEVALGQGAPVSRDFSLVQLGAGRWKAVFMAADYQDNGQHIIAWDNGRRDLAKMLTARGFDASFTRHLSRDPDIRQSENTGDGTYDGLERAFSDLQISGDDRCFLFMTSHGTRQEFYVEGSRGIRPAEFDALLTKHCGSRPTVALVSACFSGIMVNQQTQKPNRVIFTAASSQKTSQGCAPGIKYNLFEECALKTLDASKTFKTWGDAMKSCIEAQDRSDPVFYLGDAVKQLAIDGSGAGETPGSSVQNPPNGGQTPPTTGGAAGGAATTAPTSGQALTGARNLRLGTTTGTTELKSVAGAARYLLVDFSAPSCGYCLQFAALLENYAEQLNGSKCKAVTLVGANQLAAWNRNAASRGAPGAASHSYALADMTAGQALGALEGTAAQGAIPTPTILFLDTTTGQVVEKSVGALSASRLDSLLGSHCR